MDFLHFSNDVFQFLERIRALLSAWVVSALKKNACRRPFIKTRNNSVYDGVSFCGDVACRIQDNGPLRIVAWRAKKASTLEKVSNEFNFSTYKHFSFSDLNVAGHPLEPERLKQPPERLKQPQNWTFRF